MEDRLGALVDEALGQAEELVGLDAARAEAWASDLLALTDQELGPTGAERLVADINHRRGPGPAAVLAAVGILRPDLVAADAPAGVGPLPPWSDAAGTSRCEAAWMVSGRDGTSVALEFRDRSDATHLLVADLVPGPTETVGEVHLTASDLLAAADEPSSGLTVEETDVAEAARRTAQALAATTDPSESTVANGRLLAARLAALTGTEIATPVAAVEVVPEWPVLDPDDAAYALDLFERSVPDVPEPTADERDEARRAVSDALGSGSTVGEWLDASPVPESAGCEPMVAVLAATILPARLEPLGAPERDAVLLLEWADWLGASLELTRQGPGAPAGPEDLVDHVNRCAEVTTTVPAADRSRITWAFGVVTEPWRELGVVDGGRLTRLGWLYLKPALSWAWSRAGIR